MKIGGIFSRRGCVQRSNETGSTLLSYIILITSISMVTIAATHSVGNKISQKLACGGGSQTTLRDTDVIGSPEEEEVEMFKCTVVVWVRGKKRR